MKISASLIIKNEFMSLLSFLGLKPRKDDYWENIQKDRASTNYHKERAKRDSPIDESELGRPGSCMTVCFPLATSIYPADIKL